MSALDYAPSIFEQLLSGRTGAHYGDNITRAQFLIALVQLFKDQHALAPNFQTLAASGSSTTALYSNCSSLNVPGCLSDIAAVEESAAKGQTRARACGWVRAMWIPSYTEIRVRPHTASTNNAPSTQWSAPPICA